MIELDNDGSEMKVPVSKLREMMSRKPRTFTEEELEDFDDEEEEQEPAQKAPITESQGVQDQRIRGLSRARRRSDPGDCDLPLPTSSTRS